MHMEEEKVSVYTQNFLIKKQIQSQDLRLTPPGGFIGVRRGFSTWVTLSAHTGLGDTQLSALFAFQFQQFRRLWQFLFSIIFPEILCRE